MIRKAINVVSGNAMGSLLSLVRNLAVARLVDPESYGIASSFAICMSIVEMVSFLGINQLMVVDRDGDEPHFQAAMHGFQILRGVFSSLMLFLVAGLFARFMGFPQATGSFQLLALVPLVNGFQHYDPHRLRRHLNFGPTSLSSWVPPLVSVLSLLPIIHFITDYRVMLVAIFVQALGLVAVTHLSAERRYQVTLDPALIRRAARFGWPILLGSILIFGVYNGEKMIVSRQLGVVALAYFTMAFTLTSTPTLVLASSFQALFLPRLSATRATPEAFQRLCLSATEAGLLIAILLLLGTALVGAPLAHLLAGDKYLPILAMLVPMSVAHAIKSARAGAEMITLAIEKVPIATLGSLMRVLSMPVSFWLAGRMGDAMVVIWAAALVELAASVLVMGLTARAAAIDLGAARLPMLLTLALAVLCLADNWLFQPEPSFRAQLHLFQIPLLALGLWALWSLSELRTFALSQLGRS